MDDQSQQDSGQEPAQAQEQPQDDSLLTTPQADQPVPNEGDRSDDPVPTPPPVDAQSQQDESAPEVWDGSDPFNRATEPTEPRDQQADHDAREAERNAQRQVHNDRTGGGDVSQD